MISCYTFRSGQYFSAEKLLAVVDSNQHRDAQLDRAQTVRDIGSLRPTRDVIITPLKGIYV